MAYILDEAGYVTGTYDGPGLGVRSTNVSPPAGANVPLQFVDGAWVMPVTNLNISLLAFFNRFTTAERLSIRQAQVSNPVVADFMMLVNAAKFIGLADDNTVAGLGYLKSVNLVTAERAAQILSQIIGDAERP